MCIFWSQKKNGARKWPPSQHTCDKRNMTQCPQRVTRPKTCFVSSGIGGFPWEWYNLDTYILIDFLCRGKCRYLNIPFMDPVKNWICESVYQPTLRGLQQRNSEFFPAKFCQPPAFEILCILMLFPTKNHNRPTWTIDLLHPFMFIVVYQFIYVYTPEVQYSPWKWLVGRRSILFGAR